MEENEFRNFEFRKNQGPNFPCLIPPPPHPPQSLRPVSWHQMSLDAHTHTLHTHIIPKNRADSDFCRDTLWQDVG